MNEPLPEAKVRQIIREELERYFGPRDGGRVGASEPWMPLVMPKHLKPIPPDGGSGAVRPQS